MSISLNLEMFINIFLLFFLTFLASGLKNFSFKIQYCVSLTVLIHNTRALSHLSPKDPACIVLLFSAVTAVGNSCIMKLLCSVRMCLPTVVLLHGAVEDPGDQVPH